MRFLFLFLSFYVGFAACAHAVGGRHALFHKRAEATTNSPVADSQPSTSSTTDIVTKSSTTLSAASQTGTATDKSTSSSTTTSASSSSTPSSAAGDTGTLSTGYFQNIANCEGPDAPCTWKPPVTIADLAQCQPEQRFDWNLTSFYPVPGDTVKWGFGMQFHFYRSWYQSCAALVPNASSLSGTWEINEKAAKGRFFQLQSEGFCMLQLMLVGKEEDSPKTPLITSNDILYGARDALAVLEATGGRRGIGGNLKCGEDKKAVYFHWRLTPLNTGGNLTIDVPYHMVKKPWETKDWTVLAGSGS